MKITTDSNKGFVLFQDGEHPSSNFNVEIKANLGNLSYSFIRSSAELTFFESGHRIASGKIDDITVNGTQLTVDNFNETLNVLFKLASGTTPAPEAKYIESGLVQHYDAVDRGDNPATWKDLIGTNDAVTENAVWLGKSLQFNGNARATFIGAITSNYTIMGVFKRYVSQGSHPRLTAESPYPSFYLRTNNNNYCVLGHGVDTDFQPLKQMPSNEYIHLAYRYNSVDKRVELFENGIKIGERNVSGDAESTAIAYLGGKATNDRFFNGEVCNYMVYDRALTSLEILNNYQVDNKYLMLNS